jgi:hypothetical protein
MCIRYVRSKITKHEITLSESSGVDVNINTIHEINQYLSCLVCVYIYIYICMYVHMYEVWGSVMPKFSRNHSKTHC